ncbi:hypothetical protein HZ326_8636 [Fusarium oxysporum f. sp. albedinis]|nr:hypothetical protein HZ326_8636 [Fusarium oxysporum f. sp. albedinis]
MSWNSTSTTTASITFHHPSSSTCSPSLNLSGLVARSSLLSSIVMSSYCYPTCLSWTSSLTIRLKSLLRV